MVKVLFTNIYNMMGYGSSSWGFGAISEIVWLAVGILLIVWLWKQINSK